MSLRHWFVFGVALAALAAVTPARAQAPATAPSQPTPPPTGPAYAVTYFEVAPAASRKTTGELRQFAAASRKEAGNVEFLALREIDAVRPLRDRRSLAATRRRSTPTARR